ncbi:aminoacyl-tRNA hydrolase [Patescibacteria group bacterium]|nr:aminoacyl-tRNA hydrolase [Patescibacteria group bacterium]
MNPQEPQYKLIVGLGNPGPDYANTYHNVGALAVDHLIEETRPLTLKKNVSKKFQYAADGNIIFIKPLTYMNESGVAVKNALKQFKATPEEILVIHDDSDITIGEYKLSYERGAGGHKGIESIIQHLKTKKFWRLRIGIRPPAIAGTPRKKAEEFVLKRISAAHRRLLETVFTAISAHMEQL